MEYAYRDCTQQQIKAYLDRRLEDIEFFKYSIKEVDEHTISIDGIIDGSCFLVFGKKEVAFKMLLELGEASVRVSAELTKTNGRPLNYNILFSKSGKVRYSPAKNKIEDEVRTLIQREFDVRKVPKKL